MSTDRKNPSFYMVFLEGERGPEHRHSTLGGAENEARRLARTHRKKAYVLCSLKSIEVSEFVERDLRPDIDDNLPF